MGTEQSRKRVKGEVVPFGKLFAALTTLKRRDRVSEFDVAVYEDRTAHIPLSILSRAVTAWIDTQSWFPTVQELLDACEKVRCELRAAVQFEPCAACSANGWTEIEIDGVKRATRCQCWRAHQERIKALGVPDVPLALPAGRASDFEQVGEAGE